MELNIGFHYSLKKKSKALEEEHLTERVKMNETKSVSVPTFSGKEEDYELFWPRFVAYADINGKSNFIISPVSCTKLPLCISAIRLKE